MADDAAKQMIPIIKTLMENYGAMAKDFYEKFGDEALPVIAQAAGRLGQQFGQMRLQQAPGGGIKLIDAQFHATLSMLGVKLETVHVSDNEYHIKSSRCAGGIGGTCRALCEAMMHYDQNVISTYLGKKVEVEILKTVAAGDDQCETIFHIK